jgi:hypothetical protein
VAGPPGHDPQVSIAFSAEATRWYETLPDEHREIVNRRLKQLAISPERAPVRGLSPDGRPIYMALAIIDDDRVWAYRIDFVEDELMRRRGRLPAIAIRRGKRIVSRP